MPAKAGNQPGQTICVAQNRNVVPLRGKLFDHLDTRLCGNARVGIDNRTSVLYDVIIVLQVDSHFLGRE